MGILLTIAVSMTLIEYVAGIISLKVMKTRLWDYSNCWGNIQGVICPLFSLIWAVAGAGYYFLLHDHVRGAIAWFTQNLAFSFVIGMFFGVFLIDVAYSANLMVRVRAFATRNDVVVKYEHLKSHIQTHRQKAKEKNHFFLALHTQRPLGELLKEMYPEKHTADGKNRKRKTGEQ